MADIPKICATCEYWAQMSTEAFQNPLKGAWGLCRLSMTDDADTAMITKASFSCSKWELD